MSTVQVVEVGPRDGLQNEAHTLSPALRAELTLRLAAAGLTQIEAVSFVNPARVPQMAGAEEVVELTRIPVDSVLVTESTRPEGEGKIRVPGIGGTPGAFPGVTEMDGTRITRHSPAQIIGLVLNEKGFERALSAGLRHVRYAFPVTEGFARANQNTTVADAAALGLRLISRARAEGVKIGVVLATSFGCPFDGRVDPAHVLRVAEPLAQAAPDELVFADTIGVGSPRAVREIIGAAASFGVPLGGHFHNTRNTGYANAVAAVEMGAVILDSSVGGIGGCPFAPRATGNIATEDLGYLLRELGVGTGLDLEQLMDTSRWLETHLGRELPGMLYKAGDFGVG